MNEEMMDMSSESDSEYRQRMEEEYDKALAIMLEEEKRGRNWEGKRTLRKNTGLMTKEKAEVEVSLF